MNEHLETIGQIINSQEMLIKELTEEVEEIEEKGQKGSEKWIELTDDLQHAKNTLHRMLYEK